MVTQKTPFIDEHRMTGSLAAERLCGETVFGHTGTDQVNGLQGFL